MDATLSLSQSLDYLDSLIEKTYSGVRTCKVWAWEEPSQKAWQRGYLRIKWEIVSLGASQI